MEYKELYGEANRIVGLQLVFKVGSEKLCKDCLEEAFKTKISNQRDFMALEDNIQEGSLAEYAIRLKNTFTCTGCGKTVVKKETA